MSVETILNQIERATVLLTNDLVLAATNIPAIGVGLQGVRTRNGIQIGDITVVADKSTIFPGIIKNMYSIIDQHKNVLYNDLGLIESAVGIVKTMLFTHMTGRISQILAFDAAYTSAIIELHSYKTKLNRLAECDIQFDITDAKYRNCLSKMHIAKSKIIAAS